MILLISAYKVAKIISMRYQYQADNIFEIKQRKSYFIRIGEIGFLSLTSMYSVCQSLKDTNTAVVSPRDTGDQGTHGSL
jgi:hypothetical protein